MIMKQTPRYKCVKCCEMPIPTDAAMLKTEAQPNPTQLLSMYPSMRKESAGEKNNVDAVYNAWQME